MPDNILSLHITPHKWMCQALKARHPQLTAMTPRQYLWHIYHGPMQSAPESVIFTWLYDHLGSTRLAHDALRMYRSIGRIIPSYDGRVDISYDISFFLKDMHKELLTHGLWDAFGIYTYGRSLDVRCKSIGFDPIPAHLPWIEMASLENTPRIYTYSTLDDTVCSHIAAAHNPHTLLITDDTQDTCIHSMLGAYNLAYTSANTQKFTDYPTLMKMHSWLTLDKDALNPRELCTIVLESLPQDTLWRDLITHLYAYPTPLCTLSQLQDYSASGPHAPYAQLLRILHMLPELHKKASVHECLSSIQTLHTLLGWQKEPYWAVWLEALGSTQILTYYRTYATWWDLLLGITSLLSTPEDYNSSLHVTHLQPGLDVVADTIYIPETYTRPIYSPMHYTHITLTSSFIEYYRTQYTTLSSLHTHYLRHATPLPTTTYIIPTHTSMRPEETLHPPENTRISWVKHITAYTLCPRLGWLTRNILTDTTHEPSMGLNAAARGLLLHDWMCDLTDAETFLDQWLTTHIWHIDYAQRLMWRMLLESLAASWSATLTLHPWMHHVAHREERLMLKRHSFEGSLRVDLVLRHPQGLVIIDFKTSPRTLSALRTHAGLEPQLPLYWMALGSEVIGLGYAILQADGIRYHGITCQDIGLFETTHTQEAWDAERIAWERDIDATLGLIAENANDPSPFTPHHTCAVCHARDICKPH